MSIFDGWTVPADVEAQTAQLIEFGIVSVLAPHRVDGDLGDLLFWSAVQPAGYGSSLCLHVQRRDGGVGRGATSKSSTSVAFNHVGQPYGALGLSLEQLRLMELLAIGPEDFSLVPGLRLVRTDALLPSCSNKDLAPGETLEVAYVHFDTVSFRPLRVPQSGEWLWRGPCTLPRNQVTLAHFSLGA